MISLLYRLTKINGVMVWIRSNASTSEFKECVKYKSIPDELRNHDHENLDMIGGIDTNGGAHVFLGRWNDGKKEPFREHVLNAKGR